jgi:hypothetical protein
MLAAQVVLFSCSKPVNFHKLGEHINAVHRGETGNRIITAINKEMAGERFEGDKFQAAAKPAATEHDPLYFDAARVFTGNHPEPVIDEAADEVSGDELENEGDRDEYLIANDDDL